MSLVNLSDEELNKGKEIFHGMSYDDLIERDIFDLLGVKEMTPEDKKETLKNMVETIKGRVMVRIDGELSDDEALELKNIALAGDEKGFQEMMKKVGIDTQKLFAEEALIYKLQLVDMVKSKEG
jgi:hypothetical protein